MNSFISKYLFYYPATISRGELVSKYLMQYKRMQWVNINEIEAYQFSSLKKLINFAVLNSPYYKQLLSDNEIAPSSIKTLADLARIPITNKADIVSCYTAIRSSKKISFLFF